MQHSTAHGGDSKFDGGGGDGGATEIGLWPGGGVVTMFRRKGTVVLLYVAEVKQLEMTEVEAGSDGRIANVEIDVDSIKLMGKKFYLLGTLVRYKRYLGKR